jgi:hypothetical protein
VRRPASIAVIALVFIMLLLPISASVYVTDPGVRRQFTVEATRLELAAPNNSAKVQRVCEGACFAERGLAP